MKITCNIIKDLLPLYAENIANDDTKELIEEHLKECDSCMENLASMKQTQTIPQAQENEIIDKLKNNFIRVVLNIILVIMIFVASINLVTTTLNTDIGFMEFNDLDFNFETTYNFEMSDGRLYYDITKEEIEQMGEVFNEYNITDENLTVMITGKDNNAEKNFSRSRLTKVKSPDSDKYIYYIEAYNRLSFRNSSKSWHGFNGNDNIIFDANNKTHYDDYIEAIYISTPTKDYLIYGNDVATEKFENTSPFLGLHIFTFLLIILSIVCFIVSIKNKKQSNNSLINVLSLSMIILLLSTIFSLSFIIYDWHRFLVYNYYLIFNSIALTSILVGIVSIFYVISRNFKSYNNSHQFSIILMTLGVIFTMYLEKIRVFEWVPHYINLDYWYVFYPILPIYLGLMFMLGYFVYKTDANKPKQDINKSYKITQSILGFNLVVLQSYSLYIYSLKDKLINQPTYVDGFSYFGDYIFFADIINLSTGVIIIYAFYNLIKNKNYTMIGIILQAIAICIEKGCYFNTHLGSLYVMEELSFAIYILSYLMIGSTLFINNMFLNKKEV